MSGVGRLSTSSRFSSLSQKMSRLILSQLEQVGDREPLEAFCFLALGAIGSGVARDAEIVKGQTRSDL